MGIVRVSDVLPIQDGQFAVSTSMSCCLCSVCSHVSCLVQLSPGDITKTNVGFPWLRMFQRQVGEALNNVFSVAALDQADQQSPYNP